MGKRHILFYKYYKEWIETYKYGQVTSVTYDKYERALKFLKERRPRWYLDELTRADLQRLLNEYGETHELDTVRGFLHHLQAPLRDAVYEGWIKRDPTYKVVATSQVKHVQKHKWIESKEDVQKLIKVFQKYDTPETIAFDFTLRTGLRFAEMLGLTPKDIDMANMTIYVNKAWNYKDKEGGFKPTKNKYSVRMLKVDWRSLQDLQKVMTGCPENEPIFVRAIEGGKTNRRGKPKRIHNAGMNKILKRLCEEAGIRPVTVHGLRHTHASLLITNGVSIQSVAKRLGHGNTETTQRVYIHLLDELAAKDDNLMMTVLSTL